MKQYTELKRSHSWATGRLGDKLNHAMDSPEKSSPENLLPAGSVDIVCHLAACSPSDEELVE